MRVRVPKKKIYIAIAIVAVIAILAILAPNVIVRATGASHFNHVQHVVIDTANAPAHDAPAAAAQDTETE